MSFFREHILTLTGESKEVIIDSLATFPNQLEDDDVEDFFSLAQYYASKTPQSFRRVSKLITKYSIDNIRKLTNSPVSKGMTKYDNGGHFGRYLGFWGFSGTFRFLNIS